MISCKRKVYDDLYLDKNITYLKYNLPLSISEELTNKYLDMAKDNNESARKKLLEHNLRLVLFIASKICNSIDVKLSSLDINDLMGIGTLGLIKAIDKYEIQRDSKFSTFAYKVILNEMFYAIRKNGNYNSEINFDINLSDDDTLIGKTPVEQCLLEKYLEKELLEAISQQLTNFTEKQKRIIRLNFGFDCERKTQEDIGKEIGCGQKNVSRIVNEVTDDIRPDLKRQGLVDLARSKSITTRGSKKVVTKQKNKKEININVTQTKDIVYQEKLAYLFCGYNEKQIKTLIGLLENSGEKQVLLLMLGYVNNKKYSASEAAKIANIKTSKVYEVIDSALENIFGVSDIEVIIPKERVKKGIVC